MVRLADGPGYTVGNVFPEKRTDVQEDQVDGFTGHGME